jgi:N-acyl-D-aspartate/D-glutamate deacylase
LEAVARAEKADPIEAAIRIMRSGENRDAVASFNMAQSDVDLIMRQPWVVTSSDGSDGHPRQYATFPEKYALYVRKRGLITMGDFIRRSSGLTADMFNLDRRGYLRPGYFADIVVLDPARYAPKADYLHPKALSEGVRVLYVNGRAALEDGRATGVLAGRPLPRVPPPGACP